MTLSSYHRKDIENFLKEGASIVAAFMKLGKNSSIFQEKNSVGIACGKGIVCHHKDGRAELLVDTLDGSQKHLCRMTV